MSKGITGLNIQKAGRRDNIGYIHQGEETGERQRSKINTVIEFFSTELLEIWFSILVEIPLWSSVTTTYSSHGT